MSGKSTQLEVDGLPSSITESQLSTVLGNKQRLEGGAVDNIKLIKDGDTKDFDGFLGKADHVVEQCNLHVSESYQCLSPETLQKKSEHVEETHGVNQVDNSHQVHQPKLQVHIPSHHLNSVQRSTSLHTLNCTFCPLYSSVKCILSKTVQYTVKLCKFGTEFLKWRSQDLQALLQPHHCEFNLSQNEDCISLTLNWPHKMTIKEVKLKIKSGVNDFCKYLDTFIAAQCEIDNSYIHEFQEFCQRECQEEKPVVKVFFDHMNNLAVFISEHDEAGLQNYVNKMFHNFMSHIPKLDGSAGTPSLQVAFPKGSENVKQHLTGKKNRETESKDNVKKAAPKQHQFKLEQILELEEKDLILFQKTKFHKEVETRNKPMEIIFNSETMHATIQGNDMNSINSAQIELLQKARDFVRLNVKGIFSPEQLQLLNKTDVQDRINKMFEEKGHQAHFKCSADVAYLFYVKPLDDAVLREILESHVVLKTKTLDSDLAFILKSDKGQKFLSALCESTDGIRISSLVALKEKSLQIISSSQQLDVLMKEVISFAEANKYCEEEVQFSSGKQLFAKKFFHPKLSKITESVTPLGAKIIYNAESVTVQGLKDGVNLGETQLSNLSEQIVVQDISLKFFGIKEFLQTSEGKSLLTNVETSMSCVITPSTTKSQAGQSGSSKAFQGDENQDNQTNSMTLTIKKGDITAEKCDAILSGIRDSMDLAYSGAVCKALLKQCGSALQDECNAKVSEMAQKGFVATSAPNLNCKHIYHVSMDKFGRTWDRCINEVLTDAESQGITSIALPAFGTGARDADYQQLKWQIFSGVNDFFRSSKGTLKDVRLVVFSQELLDEFLSGDSSKHASDSSHGAEVTATQSLKKVSEQVALKVYADSYPQIVTATKEINTVLKQAFREQIEKHKEYKRLSKFQVLQLEMEGIKHCLKVSVSVEDGVVTMTGFKVEGFIHVVKMLGTLVVAAVTDHHKSLSEAVEAVIQWQFEQQGKWRNFEPILNSELEKKCKDKAKYHDIIDSTNLAYRIYFAELKKYLLNENRQECGNSIKVRRRDLAKEGELLPKEWEIMGDSENLKLVTLQAGSPEYQNAEQLFIYGGAKVPVKKIERIQNRSLYQQYKAKKREMDLRNPKGHANEQKLFHGTDSTSVTAINDNGFNRSYCGKNATVYGNGVYFAVTSSYSVNYAKPSASGERLMYIASVLTGVSTPSQSGMTHLPNKPGTNTPYDSGNATGMFIIFHDSQAYPEYLLTF